MRVAALEEVASFGDADVADDVDPGVLVAGNPVLLAEGSAEDDGEAEVLEGVLTVMLGEGDETGVEPESGELLSQDVSVNIPTIAVAAIHADWDAVSVEVVRVMVLSVCCVRLGFPCSSLRQAVSSSVLRGCGWVPTSLVLGVGGGLRCPVAERVDPYIIEAVEGSPRSCSER